MPGQIVNPTPPLVGGNFSNPSQVGIGSGSGYLFQSGNLAPVVSSQMTWLLDQFYAADIFERIGRNTPTENIIWSWPEMALLRQGSVVTDVVGTGGSSTTRQLTTQVPVGTPYFIDKMTIITDYGIPLNVESVNNAGTFQVLTVSLQDQVNDTWTLALGVAGAASGLTLGIGQLATADAEYQTGVAPRISYPSFRKNRLNLIKDQYALSREVTKAKTYTPDGTGWYYQADIQMMKRMKSDRDLAIMFHKWDGNEVAGGKETGTGIWQYLNQGGTKSIVDGAIQEDDIQDMITRLMRTSSASEFLCFAGSDAMADINRALRPYAVQMMANATIFKDDKMAGIPFSRYQFAGKTLTFVHLPMFDNQAALPYVGSYAGTASTLKINFRSMVMFLNMGSDDMGNKLISLRHLTDSNFLLGTVNGTIDINGKPVQTSASTLDGATKFGIMHIAPEVRNLQAHGLMYRLDA